LARQDLRPRGGLLILETDRLAGIDPLLSEAVEGALAGEPLNEREIEYLLQTKGREFSILTMAADLLRHRLVGDEVTYVVNRNINFTNICTCKCAFCGFARDRGDPDSYLLTEEQVRRKVREARGFGATEICTQGGISQEVGLDSLLGLLRVIKEEMPDVHVHAFSPMEIHHAAASAGLSIEEVLEALRESGLDSMPGTAAEILVDRVRNIICPNKITSRRWEEIVVAAHKIGLPTTATMMYGTIETNGEKAQHLIRIREIQEATGGFTEFVPLPFIHGNAPMSRVLAGGTTGVEDLRVLATARLAFGSTLTNVQVSWVKMGKKLAQIGLTCGANDFGGTLMEENISRFAGSTAGSLFEPKEMVGMIEDLGRVPRQRDTLYRTPCEPGRRAPLGEKR
jgi:FO synthase subunit 2